MASPGNNLGSSCKFHTPGSPNQISVVSIFVTRGIKTLFGYIRPFYKEYPALSKRDTISIHLG